MNFRNFASSSSPSSPSSNFLPFTSSRPSSLFSDGPPRPQHQRPRFTRAKSSPAVRPTPSHPAALEIRQPKTPGNEPLDPKSDIPENPYPSPPSSALVAQWISTDCPPPPSNEDIVKPLPSLPSCESTHDEALPTFPSFTPCFLEDSIEKRSRDMVVRDVTPDMLFTWESLHPEVRETSPLRYEYDSFASRFIVKCATSPVHESVTIFFTHQVSRALEARLSDDQYLDMVQVSSGACYRGFNGNGYTAHSKKLPDAYLHIDGYRFPTVVCETGWAETMDDLKRDARLWLLGTQGETRVVVVVAFTEIHAPLAPPVSLPAVADPPDDASTRIVSHDTSYPEETALLASINDGTQLLTLAESLLSLHNQHKLRKPLLGDVIASVHLFRATPACDGIVETFTCTLLPVPTALDAVRDIPLTLGDLLSQSVAEANDLDPDEVVLLPLARLRAIVAKQIPKQVVERSMDRAMGLMKKRGVWEEVLTFAQSKRGKRKRDTEDVQ